MAKKKTKRRLGRDGKYDSLIQHIEDTPDTLTGDDITVENIKAQWKQPPDILEEIDRYEAGARKVLEKAGLPTEHPGRFEYVDNQGRQGVCSLVSYLKRNGRVLEPEWWAAKITEAAADTRKHIEANNTMAAVRSAMLLQQHVDRTVLGGLEHATSIGFEQLKYGYKSRKYTDQDKAKWVAIADHWWSAHPELSLNNVAKRVASETGHKFSSIKPHIAERNPNRKTG